MTTVLPATPEAIARAAAVLRNGGLVAFPTETVYGLGAHALDAAAVGRIFAAKGRPDWDPLIVHVRDASAARTLTATVPTHFDELARSFWPGPLTLVVAKAATVPDEVTAGRSTVALRVPGHPVAAALLAAADLPIAAPSANRFGGPSPTRAEHVLDDLAGRVDLILDGGPTALGIESTVLDLTVDPPAILRPGGVRREQLTELLGQVALAAPVADQVARAGLAGPGMTRRHYAPRATLELFETDAPDCRDQIAQRAAALRRSGRRVAVLTCDDSNWERFGQGLYAALRQFDADGAQIVLCALPPPEDIGLALRDRLQRAAGTHS